ncbi:UNVERIFIED_CONTAM: hypothetical protein Sindi_1030100 [Sesamum indicum]
MLAFADDLLLFCKAIKPSITPMKEAFHKFSSLSGLRASVEKSNIILSKSAAGISQQLQEVVAYPMATLPIKYLGVPLVASKLKISDCMPLLDKVDGRLLAWSSKHFSYAGRHLWDTTSSSGSWQWKKILKLRDFMRPAVRFRISTDSKVSKVIAKGNWCWPESTPEILLEIQHDLPSLQVNGDEVRRRDASGTYNAADAY